MTDKILLVFVGAFLLCASLIRLTLPFAATLALAVPNERSSHKLPTPQVGGLFIVATFVICCAALSLSKVIALMPLALFLAASVFLCLIGWLDDRQGLPITIRLFAYCGFALAFGFVKPYDFFSDLAPSWFSNLLAGLFLLTMMNVTNFMDGIDGMLVAEFVPMLVLLSLLASMGLVGPVSGMMAACLAGSLLGFFLFNRPKAKIFMGDSGSVVIGFLVGVLLLDLAHEHGLFLALILPLYFLLDAGLTLIRRLLRGERFWMSHRQHFYQRALDSGQSNWSIIRRVALCNVVLSLLCFVAIRFSDLSALFVFIASFTFVAFLVFTLSRPNRSSISLQDAS